MTDVITQGAHGVLIEPATLRIERILPGPVERVWAYLTESELRRQWLAAGEMRPEVGSEVELVWRNSELTTPSSERPESFPEESRMMSRITAFDPPRRLAIAWRNSGDVTFDLEPQGQEVLLTVTHHRLPDRDTLLGVSAGWHAHLDILVEVANGRAPDSFWEAWTRLRADYERRLPA
jgi:uncharacterized protein YndB with AHSA1/START domain